MEKRYASVDLLKNIAIITMVVDHLKHIFSQYTLEFTSIGRVAFILFSLIMAFNMNNIFSNKKYNSLFRYFIMLVVFCFISEYPYQLMSGDTSLGTLNIMVTLLLSLVGISCIESSSYRGFNVVLTIVFLYLCLYIDSKIEYGVLGVCLTMFFYMMFKTNNSHLKVLFAVLASLFSFLCNAQYYYGFILENGFFNIWVISMMFGALLGSIGGILISLNLLDLNNLKVKPVGSWAWWFYPIHLLIIAVIVKIFNLWYVIKQLRIILNNRVSYWTKKIHTRLNS